MGPDGGAAEGRRRLLLIQGACALGLTVVFYALAVGLVVGLTMLGWAAVTADRPAVRAALLSFAGAGAIAYGVFPRRDRFVAPGPRVTSEQQPRLFTEIRRVAEATGEAMPAEVYIVADVNAAVAERGGILGFGSRRVMLLGLPLMAAMRVSEFRAVLAHEFGHFHGGETRLGAFIHRTGAALGRTMDALARADSILHLIFVGYARAFMRITQAISREQERLADRLAAAVESPAALAGGLRCVHGVGALFDVYLRVEVSPVLDAGYRPPITAGFREFLAVDAVAEVVRATIAESETVRRSSAFDSHPPLGERLAALGNPAPVPASAADGPATTLLIDEPGLERMLLSHANPELASKLPLAWDDVGDRVFVPSWKEHVAANRALVAGLTADGIPEAAARLTKPSRWGGAEATGGLVFPGPLATAAATALALRALERGWSLDCRPGHPLALRRGEVVLLPFVEVEELLAGRTDAGAWRARCEAIGLAGIALVDAGDGPAGRH